MVSIRTIISIVMLAGILLNNPSYAQAIPSCVSNSDTDGDGWGWENNRSCRITNNNSRPSQTTAACIDADGDGYGWNGTATCDPSADIAASGNTTISNTTSGNANTSHRQCIDPDGDGYGWDGSRTCIPGSNTTSGAPGASMACTVQPRKFQTVSVLLVGNSLMNDVQRNLKHLLDCGGYDSELATSNPGGNMLSQHDNNPTTTNLIAQGYDLTLLQEQSNSINTNKPPYNVINSLKRKIEAAGSRMGFYQTWGYQNRDPLHTNGILTGYETVAKDFNAPIIHIGRAWDFFYTSHRENPPFSLYVDYAHATKEGKALIAYVLYAYLTRESPVGQHSLFLKNRDAQLLQRVAWESYLANR